MSLVVRALEPQLEDEPALEDRRVSEDGDDPRQEAIEDEELPLARELATGLHGGAQPLFEGLLEGLGG